MAVCSRCDNELDFEPLSHSVYNYIDALCERCFIDSVRERSVDSDWHSQPSENSDDDFTVVSEASCD